MLGNTTEQPDKYAQGERPEWLPWNAKHAKRVLAKAKSNGESAEACTICFALVPVLDRSRHQSWHEKQDSPGLSQKVWDALKRTNDRIDRLMNGVVRLR